MKSLQYLTGYTIGHMINKALVDMDTALDEIEEYLLHHYSQIWEKYFSDYDFNEGFSIGIQRDDFPVLSSNFGYWFHNLLYQLNVGEKNNLVST